MEQTDTPQETRKVVSLTERQKEILTEAGLPAVFEELEAPQKQAIVAIEEMLRYAEEKYGREFRYAGYISAGGMDPEQLMAYPASGSRDNGCFTVTSVKDGYEDDYVSVYSRSAYESYMLSVLQPLLPDAAMKVYARISQTTLTDIPQDGTAFEGTTASEMWVFVDGAACSEEAFSGLMEDCGNYLQSHGLCSAVQFMRMKEDRIQYLSGSNYEDYLSEEDCYAREIVYIK